MTLLLIPAILLALLSAAFCAGVETSFLSVSRERLIHLVREGGSKANLLHGVLKDMSHATSTLLVGNNISSVAYSTASAALIAEWCSDSLARSIWSFVAAFVVLYVSEYMPKLMCAAKPLRWSLLVVRPYLLMAKALCPLTWLAIKFTNLFMRGRKQGGYRLTSSSLMRILQDRDNGVQISDFESAVISRLLVLKVKHRAVDAEAILSALRDEGEEGC